MNLIKTTATEAMQLGETFYKSGMFTDIKSAQQAIVKIMAGAELGVSPFAAMSGIHIIQGKPTIGAGLMAARVKGFGKYDYKLVKHDETICSIDYYKGTEMIGNSTFTIEDAKKAGTKNLDKYPKNMLFARAMSNGVKWFTPDIYETPVYVPEEMENITVDAAVEIIEQPKIKLSDAAVETLIRRIAAGENLDDKLDTIDFTDEQKVNILSLKESMLKHPNTFGEDLIKAIENEK